MKYKILITIPLLINIITSFSQVNYIYRDDSNSYIRITTPINFGDFNIQLKENLPDGRYILLDAWRKDGIVNVDENIIESVQYTNNLRNGPYYRFCKNKSGVSEILISANYQNGLLEGKYQNRLYGDAEDEINFVKGNRNGFNITYNRDGSGGKYISKISYYTNDSIRDWWMFDSKDNICLTGYGKSNTLGGPLVSYDKDGYIISICYLSQGKVIKFEEYYPSLVLKKVYIGEFFDIRGRVVEYNSSNGEKQYHVWADYFGPIKECFITGTISYFSKEGKLTKIEQYINKQLIDTQQK